MSLQAGAFVISYFEHRFPVDPRSYDVILAPPPRRTGETRWQRLIPPLLEYQSILTAVGHLPPHSETDPAKVAERHREKEVIKRRLLALAEATPPVR